MADQCFAYACVICDFMTYISVNLEQHFRVIHDGLPAKSVLKEVSESMSTLLKRRDILMYNSTSKHLSSQSLSETDTDKVANTSRIKHEGVERVQSNSKPVSDLKPSLSNEDSKPCPMKFCNSLPVDESHSHFVIPQVKPDSDKIKDEIPELILLPSKIECMLSGQNDLEVDIAGKPLLSLNTGFSSEMKINRLNMNTMEDRDENRETGLKIAETNLTSKANDTPETLKSTWICWVCFGKFARCMGTERTLFLEHSNSFCPYAKKDLQDTSIYQTQNLLICPKECNFITSDAGTYRKHVPMCLKSESHTKRDDFLQNQNCMVPMSSTRTEVNSLTPEGPTSLKMSPALPITEKSRNLPAPKLFFHQKETKELTVTDVRSEINSASRSQPDKTATECRVRFKSSSKLIEHIYMKVHTKRRPYKCTECGKDFKNSSTLIMHSKVHSEERPYKCTECGKCFKTFGTLNSHSIVHSEERPCRCTECGKCFKTVGILKTHSIVHSEERPYKCTECGKQFKTSCTLKFHALVHSEEKPYECTECGKCFKTVGNLKEHSSTVHSEERPYKCAECGKCFKTERNLNVHSNVHTEERPYNCTECGKHFKTARTLNVHSLMHSEKRPYKCTECGKCFKTAGILKTHSKMHSEEWPYKCTECGKCFKTVGILNTHSKMHSEERPYKCAECGKCFNTERSLNLHSKVHTEEEPYKCTECGKHFKTLRNLKIHSLVHSEERPYKCKECGVCFKTVSNLNLHTIVHKRERPYKCAECGKGFKRYNQFKGHAIVHKEERPYGCAKCGKCFKTAQSLNLHSIVHAEDKPYKCIVCVAYFKSISVLKRHIKVMHTQDRHTNVQNVEML